MALFEFARSRAIIPDGNEHWETPYFKARVAHTNAMKNSKGGLVCADPGIPLQQLWQPGAR